MTAFLLAAGFILCLLIAVICASLSASWGRWGDPADKVLLALLGVFVILSSCGAWACGRQIDWSSKPAPVAAPAGQPEACPPCACTCSCDGRKP